LVVRMAKENPGWGYDRIVRAMANLGLQLSDQTVGNILRRHDKWRMPISPTPTKPTPNFLMPTLPCLRIALAPAETQPPAS
jgi:hypothetical protein